MAYIDKTYFNTIEQYKEICDWCHTQGTVTDDYGKAMLPFISNNTFEFTADSNLKYDEELDGPQAGYLYYKDTVNDTNVKIYFPETQKYVYQGFLYGYPIDAKGKPRRIKGKKIKLTEFTHEAVERNTKIIVHVKSWEFVK